MQSAMEKQAAMMVTKRDGRMEPIDLDKIHRVIDWAANGLENVSVSQVEMRSHIQFYDGIRTDAIHETIIKSAADLISERPTTSTWPRAWRSSICARSPTASSSPRTCTTTCAT